MTTTQTIGNCSTCGTWSSLVRGRCSRCPEMGAYIGGKATSLPIGSIRSGLRLHARALSSAGFDAARIAELLWIDEAEVRAVLGERG